MVTTKTIAQQINLLEIGNQLSLTAKGLQKKVDLEGYAIVTASQLAGKIPAFKTLGDLTMFRLRKSDDSYKAETLTAYSNDDGGADLYTPDLNVLEGFTPIKYKSGIGGYVDIRHDSGLELKIAISTSEEHILELEDSESQGIEGEGMPLPSYLRLVPRPETPLHDPKLPHDVELEIVSNGKDSRKYGTPLVVVKLPDGSVIKNVICNAQLERIYQQHGNGAKFKIVGVRPKKNKEGQPIDASGKAVTGNAKPAYLVDIVNCQLADFSDL